MAPNQALEARMAPNQALEAQMAPNQCQMAPNHKIGAFQKCDNVGLEREWKSDPQEGDMYHSGGGFAHGPSKRP